MKVILLADVAKLGRRNDVKDVSSGHATNFLIPKKMAVVATPEALKRLQVEKGKIEGDRKVQEELLVKNLATLNDQTFTITEKANEKGHLFAGLHRDELAQKLNAQARMAIDPASIVMDQPIKTAGEHIIEIKAAGKSAKLKLVINPAK